MTPELWDRLKPLFHKALERSNEERGAFFGEACGDDAELKENLARLVQAAQERTRTMDGLWVFHPIWYSVWTCDTSHSLFHCQVGRSDSSPSCDGHRIGGAVTSDILSRTYT